MALSRSSEVVGRSLINVCALSRRCYAAESYGVPAETEEEDLPIYHKDSKYMFGARGARIPKPPKGTRIGKFVMGDYGLYNPKKREAQYQFYGEDLNMDNPCSPGWKAFARTDQKYGHRWFTRMGMLSAMICLFISFQNLSALVFGKPIILMWPWTDYDWEKQIRHDMKDYVPKNTERYT